MMQFYATLRKWLRGIDPRMRRIVVALVGGIVLLAGLAMIFLPGPAIVAIPVGTAILATEFPSVRNRVRRATEWARRVGRQVRAFTRRALHKSSSVF